MRSLFVLTQMKCRLALTFRGRDEARNVVFIESCSIWEKRTNHRNKQILILISYILTKVNSPICYDNDCTWDCVTPFFWDESVYFMKKIFQWCFILQFYLENWVRLNSMFTQNGTYMWWRHRNRSLFELTHWFAKPK